MAGGKPPLRRRPEQRDAYTLVAPRRTNVQRFEVRLPSGVQMAAELVIAQQGES